MMRGLAEEAGIFDVAMVLLSLEQLQCPEISRVVLLCSSLK